MASYPLKSIIFFLLLALAITCVTSARILDEEVPAVPAIAPEAPDSHETPVSPVTPVASVPATATGAVAGAASPDHALTLFMHDILGGSNPSARAVTGIVSNPAVTGQVPFAKPNGAVLPVNNGVPVNNANSGVINNNNIPFLTGLSGSTPNVIQTNGNNVNGGHELGSGLVGKAQGFYVASSEDGSSQVMAFTTMFESGGYGDSLSFFGVHRIAVSESHLAIMGGTGKYVNANGYAIVKTFPAANQQNNDGVETLLQITVYLTY
ncbi:hypothetical protein ACSBR1_033495 [Camellia fascicularis]